MSMNHVLAHSEHKLARHRRLTFLNTRYRFQAKVPSIIYRATRCPDGRTERGASAWLSNPIEGSIIVIAFDHGMGHPRHLGRFVHGVLIMQAIQLDCPSQAHPDIDLS